MQDSRICIVKMHVPCFTLFLTLLSNRDQPPSHVDITKEPQWKVSLNDTVLSAGECIANIDFHMWIVLLVAMLFWVTRLAFVVYNIIYNWEIRAFYRTALGIQDVRTDL